MEDLWPEDIGSVTVQSPATILREQASLLGKKTMNVVQAEVMSSSHDSEHFSYSFYIVAPALGNYRYHLLTVNHDITLYPLHIYVENRILEEISSDVHLEVNEDELELSHVVVSGSEEQFIDSLRLILGSSKTKSVVTALLSQSDPNWRAEEEIPF